MRLSFFGAAKEVTGSCHLVETSNSDGQVVRLLFDCGMFQGERETYAKNFDNFGFDPKTVDAIFVSHAHADHTGRLPKLVAQGFCGKIFMTEPCLALTRLVLEDAYNIMKEEVENFDAEILYELDDLKRVFDLVKTVGYHEQIEIGGRVTVMFHDAGHILGSAYVSVEAEGKRIVFSGDIGNDSVPILPETEPISQADIVICESTYGDRTHESIEQRSSILKEVILRTMSERGVLMIPSFSIERTQELLYAMDQILLNELKIDIPIFLDSPMAIRATELYRHYKSYLKFDASILAQPDLDFFSFPNLRETLSVDESKKISDVRPPFVVIAGSGMMSGGRIMHHLRHYLSNAKNHVLIIGYQAEGTLGRRIYEGAKKVRILGEEIGVRASVSAIGAFSAHGDRDKLTRWLMPEDGGNPRKIFLVDGDAQTQEVFATHLRHHLKTEVVISEQGTTYEI